MLHLGKARGLQVRPPNSGEEAELVVEEEGEPSAAIHLRWRSRGCLNPEDVVYRARRAALKKRP
jgi:hypothetical protein